MAHPPDPYRNFNFRVEIDGLASTSFSAVTLPDSFVDVVEYREGGDKTSAVRKLPGRVHYGNLVLQRGLTTANDFHDWWQTVVSGNGAAAKKNGVVTLLDGQGAEVRRWVFTGAWPCRYDVSPLVARGAETVTETLELAVDSFALAT